MLTKDEQIAKLTRDLAQARQETAPLGFTDLLTLCHQEIGHVQVEPDRSRWTTGNVGNPNNKIIPKMLRAWSSFPALQASTFNKVKAFYDQCQDAPNTFKNRNGILTIIKPRMKPLANELDLRRQQTDCVEEIVRDVVQDLIRERKQQHDFGLGQEISLENHSIGLPKEEESALKSRIATFADKVYIRTKEGNLNQLVLLVEYKPPHKLSIECIHAGLKELRLPDVTHRPTIPDDDPAKYMQESEEAVATVVAQVYTYMIDSGIQYSYLTTGQAFIFFYLDDQDLNTLLYHLAIPQDIATDTLNWISLTAIAQVLSFYILACGGRSYDQDKRLQHRHNVAMWKQDDTTRLDNMTPSPHKPTPTSSEYKPPPKRHAPAHSQSTASRKLRSSGETPSLDTRARKDDPDDSDDSSGAGQGAASTDPFAPTSSRGTKTSTIASTQGTSKTGQASNKSSGSSGKRQENYCSHQCLLGLKNQGAVDPYCPNYEFHPVFNHVTGQERHDIDVGQLRILLLAQIQRTMNTNIEPLGIQGSRGALFKLTLESHGYTMIGKGTPPHFVPDLQAEKAVYDHLQPIQGSIIPVCLGAIDSPRRYFYDIEVPIFHWLLMSYAGKSLNEAEYRAYWPDIYAMHHQLTRHNVVHTDISRANVLVDQQTKRLMMIDFERLKLPKKATEGKRAKMDKAKEKALVDVTLLKEMSPNKLLGKRKGVEHEVTLAERPAKVQVR